MNLKQYCEMEHFYKSFVDKLILCDPLDRPFIKENEDGKEQDQATKVKELVQKKQNMPTFDGDEL